MFDLVTNLLALWRNNGEKKGVQESQQETCLQPSFRQGHVSFRSDRQRARAKAMISPSLQPPATATSNCALRGPSSTLKVCPGATPSATKACLAPPSGPIKPGPTATPPGTVPSRTTGPLQHNATGSAGSQGGSGGDSQKKRELKGGGLAFACVLQESPKSQRDSTFRSVRFIRCPSAGSDERRISVAQHRHRTSNIG